MEFSRGKPQEDGKYLTYVKDLSSPEWLKPIILRWHSGRWYYPQCKGRFWDTVFLWNGPLPSGKLDDFVLTKMDFDL